MSYDLFLFDADDTLFDFGKSEMESLKNTLSCFGVENDFEEIYTSYRNESAKLWRMLELGKITKEHLRVERFRLICSISNLQLCPEKLSDHYLSVLPELVYLNDYAHEICKYLSEIGRVGIITNGIECIQKRRLEKSGLSQFIEFMVVSDECGHAKPDHRFFEYTMNKAKGMSKENSLVIGDRLETDIEGAHSFGIDACWYNPRQVDGSFKKEPKYQIKCLSEIKNMTF